MLVLLGGWLAVRRVGGQLRQPLGLLPLMAVALTVAGIFSLSRVMWHRHGLSPRRWKSRHIVLWGGRRLPVCCWPVRYQLLAPGWFGCCSSGASCRSSKELGGGLRVG